MPQRARKAGLPVLALLLAVMFGQGCMTLLGRRSQSVTVTASSVGASVFVDGKLAGVTPLALNVAKRAPGVIRIEKDGYRPVEIHLKKKKLWFPLLLGNLFWIPPVAIGGFQVDAQTQSQQFAQAFYPILSLAVYAGVVVLDGRSAKSTMIAPKHLNVRLEADTGTAAGPLVIYMDLESFRGVHWISVLGDGN